MLNNETKTRTKLLAINTTRTLTGQAVFTVAAIDADGWEKVVAGPFTVIGDAQDARDGIAESQLGWATDVSDETRFQTVQAKR